MTLTIELPDELAQRLQGRGISQERLEKVVTQFVQELLREWEDETSTDPTETATPQLTWSNGTDFARRVIANNRELFDELARL